MQKFLLILCTLIFTNSSDKLRIKIGEVIQLAQKDILKGNYEAAIQGYQTAYKMTSDKNLLFDIALAKTLVSNKNDSIDSWKVFFQEYNFDKKQKNLWQKLAQCIVNILLSAKEPKQGDSLTKEKYLFLGYIKRIYAGKGFLLCKQLVEFALRNVDFSLEETWFLNKIYADCFYQKGGYENARKLYRNLYVVLKNQEFLLDEARCLFRIRQYKKSLKLVLSISDKNVKEKVSYHTILISLYAKMNRFRDAKKVYERAKKSFTKVDQQRKLYSVAKSNGVKV